MVWKWVCVVHSGQELGMVFRRNYFSNVYASGSHSWVVEIVIRQSILLEERSEISVWNHIFWPKIGCFNRAPHQKLRGVPQVAKGGHCARFQALRSSCPRFIRFNVCRLLTQFSKHLSVSCSLTNLTKFIYIRALKFKFENISHFSCKILKNVLIRYLKSAVEPRIYLGWTYGGWMHMENALYKYNTITIVYWNTSWIIRY